MDLNELTDISLAREAYKARLRRVSEFVQRGVLSHKTMLDSINRVKEQLKLGGTPLAEDRPINPEDVFDFSLASRAYEEIKAENWDTKKYQYRYVGRR